MVEEALLGTRLSTTATTGWTDWSHGELWLFRDGILRIPIGWLKSVCFVGYLGELRNPRTQAFGAEERIRLIANPGNLWIPREAIESVSLRYASRSLIDLRVRMMDGRLLQLLTVPRKRIYLALRSALHAWLGEA